MPKQSKNQRPDERNNLEKKQCDNGTRNTINNSSRISSPKSTKFEEKYHNKNKIDKIESDENPPVEENNPDKRAITPIIKNLFGSAKGYLIASEKISEKFIIFTSFI